MTPPIVPITPVSGKVETVVNIDTNEVKIVQKYKNWHRIIETAGLVAAGTIITLYGFVEVLKAAGYKIGPCGRDPVSGIPWGTIIMCSMLIAPKVLGRASAGAAWNVIAARFGGGGSPPAPPAGQ